MYMFIFLQEIKYTILIGSFHFIINYKWYLYYKSLIAV